MNALSEAASVLGRAGLRKRWSQTSKSERREIGKMLAARRWPSYAAELEHEREREKEQSLGRKTMNP